MKAKKVLVIGGRGFVGQHVMDQLNLKGHQGVSVSRRDGLDLSDLNGTEAVLKTISPNCILNCAAHVGGIHYITERSADVVDDNLRMMLNLYKAVQAICPKARIVNPISNCSYPGDANLHLESNWWDGPVHKSVWAFANPKRMLQVISECYATQHKTDSVNFFVPNAYGPGDCIDPNRTHALNGMIIRMLKARFRSEPEFVIWGSGKPTREWIHVRDLARMLVEAVDFAKPQIQPVNIAQNQAHAIRETAEMIQELSSYDGKLVFDTSFQDGAPFKQLDDTLFKKTYPNFRFTPIREGIEETIRYYETVLE